MNKNIRKIYLFQGCVSLERAALQASFKEVVFQYEPIAAALSYEKRIRKEELILVPAVQRIYKELFSEEKVIHTDVFSSVGMDWLSIRVRFGRRNV